MAREDYRNIFGMAITAAYVRTLSLYKGSAKLMCEAFAEGFELSETDGTQIYTYFTTEGHPETSDGFFSEPYSSYEEDIRDLFDGVFPGISASDRDILSIAMNSLVFSYSVNSSINYQDFYYLLGDVLLKVSLKIFGRSYFQVYNSIVSIPFSNSTIKSLIRKDYSRTLYLLNQGKKNREVPMVNYNWYDVSSILAGPNLTLMKDIENQYYYVSGKVIYEGGLGDLENCIEDTTTISSWSGDVTFNYVRNTPCKESDSYIGPVKYLEFNRIFNDGPSSLGKMTDDIVGYYIEKDKEQLDKKDYLTNYYTLTNWSGTTLAPVFVDSNGRYDVSGGEYLYAPRTFGCNAIVQKMHIGDNYPRYIYDKNTCFSSLQNVTGFKFATLELPNEIWNYDLQFRQTNPLSDISRLRKRAWNIDYNPYLMTQEGSYLMPYFYDHQDPPVKYEYVGRPMLSGTSSLPELSFFQTFNSPTFGETASIAIYPSINNTMLSMSEGEESVRFREQSSMRIYSGKSSNLPIKFIEKISSNLSSQDLVAKKFFGMGNALEGKYSITSSLEENAGFFYTGYSVLLDGSPVNLITIAEQYNDKLLGASVKTAKYISGYKSSTKNYELENKFAKNSTGEVFTYAYFSQRGAGEAAFDESNWGHFAQLPAGLETQEYERLYGEQVVENYFPRYYEGPFSVETRKFIYPNMKKADQVFQGKLFGVPTGISFKVKVREEAVKEINCEYNIYKDGSIDDSPTDINVVRSDIIGNRIKNPIMHNFFEPDNDYEKFDYDFNYWKMSDHPDAVSGIGSVVNRGWAPLIKGKYTPSGRNTIVYDTFLRKESLFLNGIKKKYATQGAGSSSLEDHIYFDSTGRATFFYSKKPIKDGLFHFYNEKEFSCSLAYVPPLFDLTSGALVVTENLKQAFPLLFGAANDIIIQEFRGVEKTTSTGQDPMFYEYVGGRRGSNLAELEGGYHSRGIIGDRWNGEAYNTFGKRYVTYGDLNNKIMPIRAPQSDSFFSVFNSSTTGTEIWTNGFSFSPYSINRNTTEFKNIKTIICREDGDSPKNLNTFESGGFINFNLTQQGIFNPKSRQQISEKRIPVEGEESYYLTGVTIGPFDRDIEIGVLKGNSITCFSDFYIDNQKLSHLLLSTSDEERIWNQGLRIAPIIECGSPGRNDEYTILSVIPSGKTSVINVKSRLDSYTFNNDVSLVNKYPENHQVFTHIGISGNAILSLKTHVPLDADDYSSSVDKGEPSRLSNLNFINNDIPKKYSISHSNGLNGLVGRFTFVGEPIVGRLYAKPNESDFAKYLIVDAYGNSGYDSRFDVEDYWTNYAIRNSTGIKFSGYREGSRISFEIYDMQLMYDKIPYQSYKLVSPSGDCYVSGEMGYYAQADNSIFSEGVHLVNGTANDVMAEIYNPSFVSDVLKAISGTYFDFPSGSGITPVLSAPSVLKQREDPSGISANQEWIKLLDYPPYNYNKLWWPALSDLETLNPGETIEAIPPGDGNTFSNNTLIFSACQGQELPNGLTNPNIVKTYYVQDIFQMYDSVATDASLNPTQCITTGRGLSVTLSKGNLSGALVPRGTPISLISNGLVKSPPGAKKSSSKA